MYNLHDPIMVGTKTGFICGRKGSYEYGKPPLYDCWLSDGRVHFDVPEKRIEPLGENNTVVSVASNGWAQPVLVKNS